MIAQPEDIVCACCGFAVDSVDADGFCKQCTDYMVGDDEFDWGDKP